MSPLEIISGYSKKLKLTSYEKKEVDDNSLPRFVEYEKHGKVFTQFLINKRLLIIKQGHSLKVDTIPIKLPDKLSVGLGNPVFSFNGRLLFYSVRREQASGDTGIVFDTVSKRYTYIEELEGNITSARFIQNDQVIICSWDQSAYICCVQTGEVLFKSPKHPDRVNAGDISADRMCLTTACEDGYIRIWKVKDGSLLISIKEYAPVNDVIFHRDNRILISSARGQALKVWDVYLRHVLLRRLSKELE